MSDRLPYDRHVGLLELELARLKDDLDHIRDVLAETTIVLAAADALLARNWVRLKPGGNAESTWRSLATRRGD